jgi:hypothetical protein
MEKELMESDVTLYTQYVKKWFQKRLSISQAQYVEGVHSIYAVISRRLLFC